MKTVILAGDWGTRLGQLTDVVPKPMVHIGNRPVLWHIMKIYSYYGFNEFIIALGVKSEVIKDYFYDFEALVQTTMDLLNYGIENILVEKPAVLNKEEIEKVAQLSKEKKANVFVAYNRRFYASVIEAQKLIEEDGGLQSMHFEFTEWAHKIEPLEKAPGVKENWFFANSTHVVDLAFFLAGRPVDWKAFSKPGKLTWHNKTNFAGAGITEKGVLFSYLSNWESAGRWGLELLTEKRRIYLKPPRFFNYVV